MHGRPTVCVRMMNLELSNQQWSCRERGTEIAENREEESEKEMREMLYRRFH